MRALAPLLWLASVGCHLGPFYDVQHVRVGADRAAGAAAAFVEPGRTTLGELLERAGPPTRISRQGDALWLWWGGTHLERRWAGFGVGAAGFFVQLAEWDRRSDALDRVAFVVEDGVVVGVGRPGVSPAPAPAGS